MGQKVHPIGFRVGITKRHQSQWFARFTKYAYAQSLLEDRMLRNTLISVANEALNSNLIKKRDTGALKPNSIIPKVTHIKIERGLIPYEIGIQIHAENCQKLKSSLNQLKLHRELLCKLQKTRRFLISLGNQQKPFLAVPNAESSIQTNAVFFNQEDGQINNSPENVVKKKKVNRLKKKLFCFSKVKPNFVNTSTILEMPKNKRPFGQFKKRKRSNFLSLVYKKKKTIIKRLRKRQEIRQRYRRLMLKGLFVQKKGKLISCIASPKFFFSKKQIKKANFIKKNKSQKMDYSIKNLKTKDVNFAASSKINIAPLGSKLLSGSRASILGRREPISSATMAFSPKGKVWQGHKRSSFSQNIGYRIKKKFVSLFLNKMNKRFLKQLKDQMTQWNKSLKQHRQEQIKLYGALRFAPLGYNQKWSLKGLNFLKNKPLFKLLKLIKIIERKSLIKLEMLRKDFLAFGTISKSEALSYYQIIHFLKNLKITSKKLKNKAFYKSKKAYKKEYPIHSAQGIDFKKELFQKGMLVKTLTKATLTNEQPKNGSLHVNPQKKGTFLNSNAVGYVSPERVNNECRKINFIEYLKDIVKKHRTNNLFYYLSTISDARKNLKKIKQFTQQHLKFLFGINLLHDPTGNQGAPFPIGKDSVPERVPPYREGSAKNLNTTDVKDQLVLKKIKNVIDSASKKSHSEKGLSEIFLEQLEKQRTMYKQLVELNPKISIKFYSVKSENVKIKAAVIADSVIDALEKRKAFRKVIKDAKENLMRNSKVKGVKIQVSGRLNGAEIARTEWVRSGRVPLQTLRANLDYSYKTAKTIYGIIGVKVWIFKGYTKLI
jgi:ribosomal protein S3